MTPLLEFRRLTMEFGQARIRALDAVDLSVPAGEFVAVVGPSGCGKTTLLRLAAGLLRPTSGQVLMAGVEVTEPLASTGFAFQQPALLEWRTVLDNVLLPAELGQQAGGEHRQRALELLELMGLRDFAAARPRQLSGGMQQRAALARALLLQPSLLLLDEPFGALDALTREELQLELLRAWSASQATAIFVTHDQAEAVFLADRVVLLTPRPARVACVLEVPLPRPRRTEHRFAPEYVATCRTLRQALEAVHAEAAA
ncbi:MAG TPA: ABC transporter ATP-binding protein [Chloroflexota bacterium]|jgi:NitT/TauT family transport system ATP-binding protein